MRLARSGMDGMGYWSCSRQTCSGRRDLNDQAENPVDHVACLAPLAFGAGPWPAPPCAQAEDCVLHPDQLARRRAAGQPNVIEESVACPSHFWGFAHQIEIPGQHALGRDAPSDAADSVAAGRRARVGIASHEGLPEAGPHLDSIERLLDQPAAVASLAWRASDSNLVRGNLRTDLDVDIAYMYCHAEGGRGSGRDRPVLRFRAADATAEGVISAPELAAPPWSHRPVVILNGCRTAAFSPDALSPFITKLVADRHAGALIGTEIAVWDQLARFVGYELLRRLLDGEAIGTALLGIRRQLLTNRNPLGLAYTLYGVADLRMIRPVAARAAST